MSSEQIRKQRNRDFDRYWWERPRGFRKAFEGASGVFDKTTILMGELARIEARLAWHAALDLLHERENQPNTVKIGEVKS